MAASSPATHTRDLRSISVVVPAFDEELTIEVAVRSIAQSLDALGVEHEVVIVDDGSRDGTGAVADRLAAERSRVAVVHQPNGGLGSAFATGISEATKERILLWPADMTASPETLAPYLTLAPPTDVIVGCRRGRVGYTPLMRVNAWVYPRLVRALFGLELRDVNWICLYPAALLKRIPIARCGHAMLTEILVGCRDRGAGFTEIDVDMQARVHGSASAGRFTVMWRTLRELLVLWSERRRAARTDGEASMRGSA